MAPGSTIKKREKNKVKKVVDSDEEDHLPTKKESKEPREQRIVIEQKASSRPHISILEFFERLAIVLIIIIAFVLFAGLGYFGYIAVNRFYVLGDNIGDAISYSTSELKNQYSNIKSQAHKYCPVMICGEQNRHIDSVKKNELSRIIQTVINNSTTLDTITNSKIKMNEVKLNLLSMKFRDLSDKANEIRNALGNMQQPVAVMDRVRIDTKNLLKGFRKQSAEGKTISAWTDVKADIEQQVVMFANSCDNLKQFFKSVIEQVDYLMEQVHVVHVDDTKICKIFGVGCTVQKKLDDTKQMLEKEYMTMEILSSKLIELKVNAIGDAGGKMFILPPSSHFKSEDEIIKLLNDVE
ncbi:polyribonucleotide nucleotidyltransferase [Acrasis kona]|uniref:Polyribonucleotide nucleotidyltransferase n=1 Tax=Acrasis kona TaxID=1008807 RepID=A0AAW2YX50_9EUKA